MGKAGPTHVLLISADQNAQPILCTVPPPRELYEQALFAVHGYNDIELARFRRAWLRATRVLPAETYADLLDAMGGVQVLGPDASEEDCRAAQARRELMLTLFGLDDLA